MAWFMSLASNTKKPPNCSLDSAKGPSVRITAWNLQDNFVVFATDRSG